MKMKQRYIQSILGSAIILLLVSCYAEADTWTTLDYPGATQTYVSGISGNNIVGYNGSQEGFLYDGTNWININMPAAKATLVRGISGNKIIGEYLPSDSPHPIGPWHSFLYDGTSWVTIPLPAYGGVIGINSGIDDVTIVSKNQIYNIATQTVSVLNCPGAERTIICGVDGSNLVGSYDNHGFVYNMDSQNWTTIDYPGATFTRIFGIDGNKLVGSSTLNGQKLTDFIYDGTSFFPLDLPGPPTGITGNTIVGSYNTIIHDDNGAVGIFSHGYVYKITIKVFVDIKPGTCPNPFNVKSKGVLPAVILGTEDFNVMTIDPNSIRLAGVAPIRSTFEDVAAPVSDVNDCNCTSAGPDGLLDLSLKFDTQNIAQAIGDVNKGEIVTLELTGTLYDQDSETPIEGSDCILIIGAK